MSKPTTTEVMAVKGHAERYKDVEANNNGGHGSKKAHSSDNVTERGT